MLKKLSSKSTQPVSLADHTEALIELRKTRPLQLQDLQAHGMDPTRMAPDLRLGCAKAIYKGCKAHWSPNVRAESKAQLYSLFAVPEDVLEKHQERKRAHQKFANMDAHFSGMENYMHEQAKAVQAEMMGSLKQEFAALQKAHFQVASKQALLNQRASNLAALRNKPGPQDVRVEVDGKGINISRQDIAKYPNAVLAQVCEETPETVLQVPKESRISFDDLQDVASFYRGNPGQAWSPEAALSLRQTAKYFGLPELEAHVLQHTELPEPPVLKDLNNGLAQITLAVKSLHEALAPAGGWKTKTVSPYYARLFGQEHEYGGWEPVDMTGEGDIDQDVLLRQPVTRRTPQQAPQATRAGAQKDVGKRLHELTSAIASLQESLVPAKGWETQTVDKKDADSQNGWQPVAIAGESLSRKVVMRRPKS